MVLGEKHYKCISMLIEGGKITEIAKNLPASRQSIYNWLEDEEFKAELDKERQEIKKRGKDRILNNFDVYLNKLNELALNSPSDNVKLNALEFLVEHIIGKPTSKTEITTTEDKKEDNVDIDMLLKEIDEPNNNVIELLN